MDVILLPMFLILMAGALWAQFAVKGRFKKYSQVQASSGLTGAQAAFEMLNREGIHDVAIERTQGFLSDHYDPRTNTIRLSPEVYDSRSIAALGVACHEAGHAIQAARRYAPLVIRNAAVPAAGIGSQFGLLLIIGGFLLGSMDLAIIGVVLFSFVAFFQVINLPVEFDATARAKRALVAHGLIQRGPETAGVNKVLNAAAMTYVVATLTSIFYLVYYIMLIMSRR